MKNLFSNVRAKIAAVLAVAASAFVLATPAHAFDGTTTATIASVQFANDGNSDIRVTQTGISAGSMCSGSSYNFARLTSATTNYAATVSMLLLAWSTGASVTLYTNVSSGVCYIQYVSSP